MHKYIYDLVNKNGKKVQFADQAVLFDEGDLCQGMLIVTAGSIKVIKYSEEGKEALLYRVNPDNLCVLTVSCLIGKNPYTAQGISEGVVEGFFMNYENFNILMNQEALFREFIFTNFAQRISDFIQKIDDITFKSIKDRLIDFINKSTSLDIQMTHQDLATELGTSREVISRLLKNLENEGLVDLSRGHIKKV